MARRRRMTRILPRTDKPSIDSDHDEELDGLLCEVLDPTASSEEEAEELDLLAIRRKVAESVGAPVRDCATIILIGGDLLFERTSPDHPLSLGRHESSDLVIPDHSVSRRHAELTYNGDVWFLRDVGSRSGTKVNGQTATGLVQLREGDRIQLGSAVLNVSFGLSSDSDANPEPALLLDGKAGVARKSTSPVRTNATAGDTPVFADEVPCGAAGASSPADNIAGLSSSSSPAGTLKRVGIARSTESDRDDVMKRQLDIRNRSDVENIKTIGVLGGLAIAAFLAYSIASRLNAPTTPVAPSSSPVRTDTERLPERKIAQAPAVREEKVGTEPQTQRETAPVSVQRSESQVVPREERAPVVAPAGEIPVVVEQKQEARATQTPAKAVDVPPTESPVSGAAAQALNPKILALTCVGGAGDQFIQEVGFLPDGTIFGKGAGFMVSYSKDGVKCLGISVDLSTSGKDFRGANWANKGSSVAVEGFDLTIGYRQVHEILQQPFIESSAGWTWWGWSHEQAKKRELMADSRGVVIYPLPGGRFLAKCWCVGDNTVLEKDPRDMDRQNPALANAYNRSAGGSASLYIVGNARTGEPLHATWMIHRPQAEAVDAQGRVYISQQAARKHGPVHQDSLGLGGRAGLSIFSPDLRECLFSGTLGGDETYAVAVRDNLLVVGGSIGMARKDKDGKSLPSEIDPAGLPQRNPAQPKPGGGEDGFLAILKLW